MKRERIRPGNLRNVIGVMGPSMSSPAQCRDAEQIGACIAEAGFVLVTGGLGGIMEAASKGAHQARGLVVGICPTAHRWDVNDFVHVAIATSMGGGRNLMNVLSCDAVIAIGNNDSAGTLSEIAFCLQQSVPLMVYQPPEELELFLRSFKTPGRAQFGRTIEDVRAFLSSMNG